MKAKGMLEKPTKAGVLLVVLGIAVVAGAPSIVFKPGGSILSASALARETNKLKRNIKKNKETASDFLEFIAFFNSPIANERPYN